MLRALLDLIFPVSCPCCGNEPEPDGPEYICGSCWQEIEWVNSKGCLNCGRPLEASGTCGSCEEASSCLDSFHIACYYSGNIRSIIINFKYNGKRYLGKTIGDILSECWKETEPGFFDAVVPVPLHPSRLRQRGYNQSLLAAKRLSLFCGIPVRTELLTRSRDTSPQVSLGKEERDDNMKRAFTASSMVREKKILIVDDVATTGATVRSCALALKMGGAAFVGALAAAHGK